MQYSAKGLFLCLMATKEHFGKEPKHISEIVKEWYDRLLEKNNKNERL